MNRMNLVSRSEAATRAYSSVNSSHNAERADGRISLAS